jgi:hypothetical protein
LLIVGLEKKNTSLAKKMVMVDCWLKKTSITEKKILLSNNQPSMSIKLPRFLVVASIRLHWKKQSEPCRLIVFFSSSFIHFLLTKKEMMLRVGNC